MLPIFRKPTRVSVLVVIAMWMVSACVGQAKPDRTLILPPSVEPQTLGPGDQIQISALHAEELGTRPIRVDSSGFIMLPGLGSIKVSGLATDQVAAEVRTLLSKTIRDPEVAVDIVELHSRPVSVLGAVKTPGVYQMTGQKRLLEVIAQAGGFDQEAGDVVKISRAQPGHPGDTQKFDVIDVHVTDLMEGRRPETNILIHTDDIVTVPRAKLVYVIGQVRKPGGFVLREQADMSVLKALSLAEGMLPTAATGNARVLREIEPHGKRQEIMIDVKAILAGKAADQSLLPEDVLLIPTSAAKTVAARLLEMGAQTATGLVIWRSY
jgi:polysaccharide export outer membrane protein